MGQGDGNSSFSSNRCGIVLATSSYPQHECVATSSECCSSHHVSFPGVGSAVRHPASPGARALSLLPTVSPSTQATLDKPSLISEKDQRCHTLPPIGVSSLCLEPASLERTAPNVPSCLERVWISIFGIHCFAHPPVYLSKKLLPVLLSNHERRQTGRFRKPDLESEA